MINRDPVVTGSSSHGDPETFGVPRVERHITVIWALLFFNCLPFLSASVLPLPQRVAQLLTAVALVIALLMALQVNPRMLVRPNVVLTLATLLAVTALVASVRGTAGVGGPLRCLRLTAFLATLWLLTPWWGERDGVLARCHLRVLIGVSASVLLGVLIAPSTALGGNRLSGVLWPIPAPQVGELGALLAGFGIVRWLSQMMSRAIALSLAGAGVAMILLSHTRTAFVGLVAGLILSGATLLLSRRRVRRIAVAILVVAPLMAAVFAPAISSWFRRDQSSEQLHGLTGRTQVWTALKNAPRSEFTEWFGIGLSNKSFDGHPIDSTWLAVYQEQGIVGVVLVGAILLFLLISAGFARAGPARALSVFILVYCTVASYTEVGLGDATPYLLHIVVAASLLVASTTPVSSASVAIGADQ